MEHRNLNLEAWGIISFDPRDEALMIEAVCELDSRPDLKQGLGWDHHGARHPIIAGLGLDFAAEGGWTVQGFFERLGWEYGYEGMDRFFAEGELIHVPIQKQGLLEQESVIFAAMAHWADIDVEAHAYGGRGDRLFWRWVAKYGKLEMRLGDIVFEDEGTPIIIDKEIKA